MSMELQDVTVKKFESEVIHVFQPMVKDVKTLARVKDAKGAKQVQFNLMGKGQASQRTNYHTDIPLMNITHDPKIATVTNWTASELTDIFLNNQVGFDERNELALTITAALKRRMLQIMIDAMSGASLAKTVADTISGSADDLTVAAFRASGKLLSKDGVDKDGRVFMAHTNGIHHLTEDEKVTSSDYFTQKTLVKGDMDGQTFYGFDICEVPDMAEGGLPVPSSNHRNSYAYHKNAVGLAINMEPKITIDWEPSKGAHRVTGYMSAGAVVIDPTGAVEVTTDES